MKIKKLHNLIKVKLKVQKMMNKLLTKLKKVNKITTQNKEQEQIDKKHILSILKIKTKSVLKKEDGWKIL